MITNHNVFAITCWCHHFRHDRYAPVLNYINRESVKGSLTSCSRKRMRNWTVFTILTSDPAWGPVILQSITLQVDLCRLSSTPRVTLTYWDPDWGPMIVQNLQSTFTQPRMPYVWHLSRSPFDPHFDVGRFSLACPLNLK